MSTPAESHLVQEVKFAKMFQNFTVEEMRCKCGKCKLPINDPEFYSWCQELQHLRNMLQFPFHVTSWYRCPEYNDSLYVDMGEEPGDHLDGPHTIGATDLVLSFERMCVLVKEATSREMGVGIKQHGPVEKRFIHLDNLGFRLWTYP